MHPSAAWPSVSALPIPSTGTVPALSPVIRSVVSWRLCQCVTDGVTAAITAATETAPCMRRQGGGPFRPAGGAETRSGGPRPPAATGSNPPAATNLPRAPRRRGRWRCRIHATIPPQTVASGSARRRRSKPTSRRRKARVEDGVGRGVEGTQLHAARVGVRSGAGARIDRATVRARACGSRGRGGTPRTARPRVAAATVGACLAA